jgi:hypothetical protein
MSNMNSKLYQLIAGVFLSLTVFSQNPVVQTYYTADPAPMVHTDTLFLFTGHDEDEITEKGFVMNVYSCFFTPDMVNWIQHGPGVQCEPYLKMMTDFFINESRNN